MANQFLTPETLVNAALAELQHEIVLPTLVDRSFEPNFTGGMGDTINIRRPTHLTHGARTYTDRSEAIKLDEVAQTSWSLTLGPQIYSAVRLTDEDLSRDLTGFTDQVLRPQVRAVSEAVEKLVIDQIEGVSNTMAAATADGDTDIIQTLIDLKVKLDRALVPATNRNLVISPDLQGLFLSNDILLPANTSGDGGDRIRNATLGRVMGFDVFTVDALADGTMVGFVPEAFHLITAAPVATQSMVRVANNAYNSISMRWLQDYDAAFLVDRSILSTYASAGTYEDPVYGDNGTVTSTEVVRAVKVTIG